MTTDTLPKCASRQVDIDGQTVTFTGMSKGAGMIRPNMATMLGYLATDAWIAQPLLDQLVREAAGLSFNSITVDGDTSTNDSFILIATGQVGEEIVDEASSEFQIVRTEVIELAQWLAQAIVRDGEGATKFMSIVVEGGKDADESAARGGVFRSHTRHWSRRRSLHRTPTSAVSSPPSVMPVSMTWM